jgi:hypothetical protein
MKRKLRKKEPAISMQKAHPCWLLSDPEDRSSMFF